MPLFNRRQWINTLSRTTAGLDACAWLAELAAYAEQSSTPKLPKSCIVLWMNGGPAQNDTFDLKPGHPNGGPFKEIDTSAPGVKISEHLPQLAQQMHHAAVIRSMSTREGDHGRATQHLRTGYIPAGSIQYPSLGSLIAHERQATPTDLPNYVSINPQGIFAPGRPPAGFLGPEFGPLVVGKERDDLDDASLRVQNLQLPDQVSPVQAQQRLAMLRELERDFLTQHPGLTASSHQSAYDRAVRIMSPQSAKAFNLDEEPAALREAYGRNRFGQGCLLARRLVERHVPFVEVSLGSWDTHDDNFNRTQSLCNILDPAYASLLADLKTRGLLDSTLVVWMGEFGRTPVINPQVGRDHYPKAWSVVLSGGGIKAGRTIGRTSADGQTVDDRPVAVPDLLATICLTLGLDPKKQNMSNVKRPIRLVDPDAKPITEILT